MGEAAKKEWRIETDEGPCKACHICAHFCPTKTLELNGITMSVKDLSSCIGCQLCDIRCPDFAIQVFPKQREEKVDVYEEEEKVFTG